MSENNPNEKLTQQRRWNLNHSRSGPGAQCQKQVRPIYPARFSLTADALNKAAESGVVPPPPTGINDPNYNLRRLRQGYFYIYAEHPTVVTDGYQGHWLIFQYYVDPKDSNSEELAKESRDSKRYSFTQYIWKDGNPYGIWEKEQIQGTFPFAYAHPQTAIIEFAYSEYRWPPELFEKLESDLDARAKIMQRLELKNRESDFSFTWTEESLRTRVEDFNPESQEKDKLDSHRRATGIGYDPNHKIQLPPSSCKGDTPIVVAVYDPIGNIQDVSAYQDVLTQNYSLEQATELYPTATAKAIKAISEAINHQNWLKKFLRGEANPKNQSEDATKLFEEYANQSNSELITKLGNLAVVQSKLLQQRGRFTALAQVNVLADLLNRLSEKYRVLIYAILYFVAAMARLGNYAKGIEEQAKLFILQKDKSDIDWADALNDLLSAAAAVNEAKEMLEDHRIPWDRLMESVSAAQLWLWQKGEEKAIRFERYLSALGAKLTRIDYSKISDPDAIANFIRSQMQTLISNTASTFETVKTSVHRMFNSNARFSSWVIEGNLSIADERMNVSVSTGAFIAGGLLVYNLNEWSPGKSSDQDNILLAPGMRLAADYCAFMGTLHPQLRKSIVKPLKNMVAPIAKGAVKFAEHVGLRLPAQFTGQGYVKYLDVITYARVGNVLAVLICSAEAFKKSKLNDDAGVVAGITGGLSEVSFLLASFNLTARNIVTGSTMSTAGIFTGIGILLAIISVVASAVSDNEFESWVRSGFWGNSKMYWDKTRVEISDEIESAKEMGNIYDSEEKEKLEAFFQKEMQDFYNLVWSINITKLSKYTFLLECPVFKDVTKLRYWISSTTMNYSNFTDPNAFMSISDSSKINKQFIKEGYIQLDLSQTGLSPNYVAIDEQPINAMYKNILQLNITYPKFNGEGMGLFGGDDCFYGSIQFMENK